MTSALLASVSVGDLRRSLEAYLGQLGMPAAHAAWTADYLVDTERSGVVTHGLSRIPQYARALKAGSVDADPTMSVLDSTGPVLRLDGGNGLGQVVGTWMLSEAARVVHEHGVALVTVRRANHLGALGYYLRRPEVTEMAGILSQATAPIMANVGATEPRLGNNPLAMSVPRSGGPVVLDLSCSEVSRGRIRRAAREDEPIPDTWALGPDGAPATSAADALAGALLPFAGHKGAALATMLGAFSGVLSGAAFGGGVGDPDDVSRPRDIGYFVLLFDVARLLDPADYDRRLEEYLAYVGSAPLRPGAEPARIPGQRSARLRADHADAVEVAGGVWADLESRLNDHGIAVPEHTLTHAKGQS